MYSVLPFLFCGPVGHSCMAYLATRMKIDDVESSQTLKNQLSIDRLSTKTQYRGVGDVERVNIKELLNKHGIRRDVKIIEAYNPYFSDCCATNRFMRATAVIYVPPDLAKTDPDALRFLIIREIAHMKNNTRLLEHLIPAISSIAMGMLAVFVFSFSVFLAMLTTYTIACLSYALITTKNNLRADEFAIQNSSKSELEGARRFYISLHNYNVKKQAKTWKPFFEERTLGIKKFNIEIELMRKGVLFGASTRFKEGETFPALEKVLQDNADGFEKYLHQNRLVFYTQLFFKFLIPGEAMPYMRIPKS